MFNYREMELLAYQNSIALVDSWTFDKWKANISGLFGRVNKKAHCVAV